MNRHCFQNALLDLPTVQKTIYTFPVLERFEKSINKIMIIIGIKVFSLSSRLKPMKSNRRNRRFISKFYEYSLEFYLNLQKEIQVIKRGKWRKAVLKIFVY